MPRTCKHPGCTNPVFSGGYCIRHYAFSPKGRAAWLAVIAKPRFNRKPQVQRSSKGGIPTKKSREDSTSGPKPAKSGRFWTAVDVADTWFSRYVRLLYAVPGAGSWAGMLVCQCVTSGRWYPIKEITNGHYMSRRHLPTRWALHNCGPQSLRDNYYGSGESQKFALWLDSKFGPGAADRARVQAHTSRKFNAAEVRAIAEHFKAEFTKLAAEKGDPWKK